MYYASISIITVIHRIEKTQKWVTQITINETEIFVRIKNWDVCQERILFNKIDIHWMLYIHMDQVILEHHTWYWSQFVMELKLILLSVGCHPEQQMMYAGSVLCLIQTLGLTKVGSTIYLAINHLLWNRVSEKVRGKYWHYKYSPMYWIINRL